jgi:hypothetical protein
VSVSACGVALAHCDCGCEVVHRVLQLVVGLWSRPIVTL